MRNVSAVLLTTCLLLSSSAQAEEYSPYVNPVPEFASGVLWGDTHLHTSYSTDAGMIGTVLSPEEAYRFARGETVRTNSGQRARLIRPLDFLVVADHAVNLGLAPLIGASDAALLQTEWGKRLHDLVKDGRGYEAFSLWAREGVARNRDLIDDPAISRTLWDRQIGLAERFNQPGLFTAMIGYEWTSSNNITNPGNLHRVVIFRDGADKVGQIVPFSTFDSPDPEDLWSFMASYEANTGGSVLAIPHNSNLSNGLMFAVERLSGEPIDAGYAARRAHWEPLVEVTQYKGDSETHPQLSSRDEFADYGTWDKGDIAGFKPKEDWMLPHEYVRSALQIGLQQAVKLGVNPFKFGMIGSTDSHTGLATTRDENYWGKTAVHEPAPDRMDKFIIRALSGNDDLNTYMYETLASGLAAVWAPENTRAGLFGAMQRKETYATTGTRIVVRFFGGWEYTTKDVTRPDVAAIGYAKGVPMGGDLPERPDAAVAPTFITIALKDPWGVNLDRIQIIKGWVSEDGERHERIYDVAVADGRTIDADGRCRTPVGNTVDTTQVSVNNNIGDAELRAVWTDPDFDTNERAVYYVRVLEIPTPTWQAFDMKVFGNQAPTGAPLSHQERAYTSPIWYTPISHAASKPRRRNQ